MRLPWAKKKAASVEAATASVKQSALPLFFCFGCRGVIVVTTETDRRLLLGRLPSEGS